MKYRAEIDGLRALAVLPVIFFHMGLSWLPGGFIGVDVFFVISGYLITQIILADLEQNRFNILYFYERRARRILPALSITLIFSVFAAIYLLTPESLRSFGKVLAGVSTFTSNMVLMTEHGYFALPAEEQPLLHTWSLSVEEQFYVFFPLFLFLIYLFNKAMLLPLLVLGVLLSFLFAVWGVQNAPNFTFFLLFSRAWELGIGCLLAVFSGMSSSHRHSLILQQIFSVIGFLLVLGSFVFIDRASGIPSFPIIIPVIGTALIIYFAKTNTFIGRLLSYRLFVTIGLLSYSAYLFHQPLIVFTKIYFDFEFNFYSILFALIVIFALAYISWRYIETPFRSKSFLSSKQIFQLSALSLILFLIIGITLWKSDGFIDKYPEYKRLTNITFWPEEYNHSKDCKNLYKSDQYCLIKHIDLPPTQLLIGDSHANHFYHGLSKYSNENLLMIGAGGCPPIFDIDLGYNLDHGALLDCYSKTNDLYKGIIAKNKINKVYLSFANESIFNENIPYTDVLGTYNSVESRYDFIKSTLKRTIEYFKSNNIEVVFIEDLPDINFDKLARCAMSIDILSNCYAELKLLPIDRRYNQLLNELELIENVSVLRTKNALVTFPLTDKGDLLYRDNTHLTKKGSLYVIESSTS